MSVYIEDLTKLRYNVNTYAAPIWVELGDTTPERDAAVERLKTMRIPDDEGRVPNVARDGIVTWDKMAPGNSISHDGKIY